MEADRPCPCGKLAPPSFLEFSIRFPQGALENPFGISHSSHRPLFLSLFISYPEKHCFLLNSLILFSSLIPPHFHAQILERSLIVLAGGVFGEVIGETCHKRFNHIMTHNLIILLSQGHG